MSLAFLSPAEAAQSGSFQPVARSPMSRRQAEAGARFDERDGWRVPVALPGEDALLATVGIADLSHLGKLEVRGAGDGAGGQTSAGSDVGVLASYAISPRRTLVLCETAVTGALREQLAEQHGFVLDVTAAYGVLALAGPQADTLLRRLTHLHSFPASGEVAHVNGVHVLERPAGYWLVVPQELGDYLWEVAVDRAQPLGGGPVGVDVLREAQ